MEEYRNEIRDGNIDRVRQLLARKSDKLKDNFDCTPLHYAALFSQVDITKLLLEYGADVTAQDKAGMTAFHYAAGKGDDKIFSLLLQYYDGNVKDIVDNDGNTVLHSAICGVMEGTNCWRIIKKCILECEMDPYTTNNAGETPKDFYKSQDELGADFYDDIVQDCLSF